MLKQFSSVRFYHWCDFFFKLSAVFRIIVSTLPPEGGGHLRKFFLSKNRALSFSVNQLFEIRDLFHALYSCLTLIKKTGIQNCFSTSHVDRVLLRFIRCLRHPVQKYNPFKTVDTKNSRTPLYRLPLNTDSFPWP